MPIDGIAPSWFVPATCEAELTNSYLFERNAPAPVFYPEGLFNRKDKDAIETSITAIRFKK
jgi:hypothetical protein